MPETTDDLRERYAAAMRTAFRQWASTDDDACNSHEVGEHFAIAAAAVRDAEVERLRGELAEAKAKNERTVAQASHHIGEVIREREEQRQRAEQAEAAIARVRELHSPETDPRRMPDCKGCRTVATITPYESCRTIAALDASSTEETADGC